MLGINVAVSRSERGLRAAACASACREVAGAMNRPRASADQPVEAQYAPRHAVREAGGWGARWPDLGCGRVFSQNPIHSRPGAFQRLAPGQLA